MEQATRDNKNKLDYTILPWEVVGEVVKVFEFGASKYTRDNYQQGDGLPLANYHQSAMRHLVASMTGEWLDPESQLDHMAHVAANALMYLWQKQHEAKKPEMVELECSECGMPFIQPISDTIECAHCGHVNFF